MKFRTGLAAAALLLSTLAPTWASEGGHPEIQRVNWSFAGVFGRYDQKQLRRGFQVFKEVCSNCHSAELLKFRNLMDAGGVGLSETEAKALAAQYKVKELSDKTGEMEDRPARLSDPWPSPFPNEILARQANGGGLPPDMSVLAKARGYHRPFPFFLTDFLPGLSYQEHGPDYIHALLNGYKDPPPPGQTLSDGQYWNEIIPGNKIAMPPPLSDGQVTYEDGAPATVKQYSQDVAAFLMWMAEPKLDERKRVGGYAILYAIVLAGLLYACKKALWSKIDH